MEKIKFDYLLECISDLQELQEMARPATAYGPLNAKFTQLSPQLGDLDPTLRGSSSSKPNLFRKTVIGVYNDMTNEFIYTNQSISAVINRLVDNLLKDVDKDFKKFDIDTFEDVVPNSQENPHYDSAIKLIESIIYSKYYPDFKSLSSDKFAALVLPKAVTKQMIEIGDNISNKKTYTSGRRLDDLIQQRFDMLENPGNKKAALMGPLDIVKYVNDDPKTDTRAVESAFNTLFIKNPTDPEVLKRREVIQSPAFDAALTLDIFDHYRLTDRSRSSSATASDRIFSTANAGVSKSEYNTMRVPLEPIIKELKHLNRLQRETITKRKDAMAISPTLKKYQDTGTVADEIEETSSYDLNEYLSTILSVWGVDVKKHINTPYDPSKQPTIKSTIEPSIEFPREAVNNITMSSYNLITSFLDKYYDSYEAKGLVFTADDFKTKVVDKIASLGTAPNEAIVLESIYEGMTNSSLGKADIDPDKSIIPGIENSVVRAVFNKPENQGKLDAVKNVILMELKAIQEMITERMNKLLVRQDKEMMQAGAEPVQQPPVQESYDYTLDYMDTQIKADSKFKGRSVVYENKNITKPLNYWHWRNTK
jgi:hypothetical protein